MEVNFWGALIKRLRTNQGWSQRALSDLSDVPKATLRRIEEGETPGTVYQIEALLEILGHDLDAIHVHVGVSPKALERLRKRIADERTPDDVKAILRDRLTYLSATNCKRPDNS